MMDRREFVTACVLSLSSAAAVQAAERAAGDVPFGARTVVRFADVREGIEALTLRDAYIQGLSPFDRQVRPRTDRDVSEQELLAFIASHVAPWTEAEVQKLTPLVAQLAKKAAPWRLKLPPVVLLVKTTGREEGGAAYCRGPAIVLPQNLVGGGVEKLAKILPHELFHVTSSNDSKLRDALYATIGFKPCNEVQLPESLRARKISNPDAPSIHHYITVTQEGRQMDLVPVLVSKSPRYDAAKGGNLFAYLDFRLMQVAGDQGVWRPVLVDGNPVLLDPAAVSDFHEQIGRNTRYIIHPEEVLADNFMYLLDGRIDLPTPRVVEQMGRILQESAER